MTYAQVLELDADTVLHKLHLEQSKSAYLHRLQALKTPKK